MRRQAWILVAVLVLAASVALVLLVRQLMHDPPRPTTEAERIARAREELGLPPVPDAGGPRPRVDAFAICPYAPPFELDASLTIIPRAAGSPWLAVACGERAK